MAFQVIEYSSKYFKSLKRRCLEKNLALALTHKGFVEWYYNSNNRCKLYLLIEGNEVLASLGQELIDFVYKGQKIPISFLSNFVSFDAGHGGFLFLHWIKNFKYCGIFGGSEYTQTLCRNQGWKFFQDFNVFSLNREIRINSNDGILKRTGKKISNAVSKKRFQRFLYRLPSLESNGVKIKVIEIRDYKNNIQAFLEKPNIYHLYVNQDLKYLNWRFNTHLGFVHYRAFEIYNQDKLSAYLIVNEGRNKIYISDLFLEDPADFEVIFYNFLKKYSYKELVDKEIIISTSNLHIKTSINSIGFESRPRPFAIGSINANIDILDDTAQWLINIGISDNDLRYPFLNDSTL